MTLLVARSVPVVDALLAATARSIKYQITLAKLPLAKDVEEFRFEGTPINDTLVRDLATGNFLTHQRNVVLVGGTGTARRILPSPLRGPASPMVRADGSTPWSTW
jgi:hypothetical protein